MLDENHEFTCNVCLERTLVINFSAEPEDANRTNTQSLCTTGLVAVF